MMDGSLGFYIIVMLISGSANTLLMKHQTRQMVPLEEGGEPQSFDHPYLQTFFMLLGEMFCLGVFSILVCRKNSQQTVAANNMLANNESNNPLTNSTQDSAVVSMRNVTSGSEDGEKNDEKEGDADRAADSNVVKNDEKGEEEKGVMANLSWPAMKVQLLFILPVLCDCCATTLVNYSYVLIPASVIQMTRGSVVLFTCIFSIVFLGRKQMAHHWAGVFLVVIGITCVSISQLEVGGASKGIITGLVLCIVAQMFQAWMMVVEEKFISSYPVSPLLAVGLEGFFGCIILSAAIPIVQATSHEENVQGAFYQMAHSSPLLWSVIASIFSIAFFNWAGITVTLQASCVARSTIDCTRTVIIWAVELAAGWAGFHYLQFIGFIILVCGTLIYNGAITVPALDRAVEKLMGVVSSQDDDKIQEKIQERRSDNVSASSSGDELVKSKKNNLIKDEKFFSHITASTTTASSGSSDDERTAIMEKEAKKANSTQYGTASVLIESS